MQWPPAKSVPRSSADKAYLSARGNRLYYHSMSGGEQTANQAKKPIGSDSGSRNGTCAIILCVSCGRGLVGRASVSYMLCRRQSALYPICAEPGCRRICRSLSSSLVWAVFLSLSCVISSWLLLLRILFYSSRSDWKGHVFRVLRGLSLFHLRLARNSVDRPWVYAADVDFLRGAGRGRLCSLETV